MAEFLDLISSLGFVERDEASPVNRRELTTLCHGCFRVFAHTPKLIDIVLKQPPRQARFRRGRQIGRSKGAQLFRISVLARYVALYSDWSVAERFKMKTRLNSKGTVLHADGIKKSFENTAFSSA